jgi:putative ABC transport system permease protein
MTLRQLLLQSWDALRRNPARSALTMLGIVWGIASVTLLMAYGSSFRGILMHSFEAFGKGAVIGWPGTTSEQAGGERAGKAVKFERDDLEAVRQEGSYIQQACLEYVKFLPIAHNDRMASTAIRGVCPAYGEMRNEIPSEGRWISSEDEGERRRVIFLGSRLREKLFGTRYPIEQEVTIHGVTFTVIGVMERKMQDSNYFTSDDESAFIPETAASYLWDTRYASVIVFTPVNGHFEALATQQVRASIAKRQHYSPTDQRAIQFFGREEFRPIIEGITIGLQALLLFIGMLTLAIGGVGVMNIMLVSVDERTREIGLRRALGATRGNVQGQVLIETLILTLAGGAIGILLCAAISAFVGTLPLLGTLFEDTSGRGDIHLSLSPITVGASVSILVLVGVLSGLLPARKASRLDPADALRYE